jgi:hypothetical protein
MMEQQKLYYSNWKFSRLLRTNCSEVSCRTKHCKKNLETICWGVFWKPFAKSGRSAGEVERRWSGTYWSFESSERVIYVERNLCGVRWYRWFEESVSLSLRSRRYLGGGARGGKARGEGECKGERKNGRGPSHFSSLSFSCLRIPPPPPLSFSHPRPPP